MEKKRFIFDLDKTLLTCDYSKVEGELFKTIFGEKSKRLSEMGALLDEYELLHPKYDEKSLGKFLTNRSGLDFNEDVIKIWTANMTEDADTMEEDAVDVLKYLKNNDKSLVVLTNWFGKTQIARLKNAGLFNYFDDIFTGDYQLKPHKEAYLRAIGNYAPSECIMIGDSILKDYEAPLSYGIDSILYDKENEQDEKYVKIKKLNEIIKRY